MGTRKKHDRSRKSGAKPTDKKASKPAATKPAMKKAAGAAARIAPARGTAGTAAKAGTAPYRAEFADAGLGALRARLEQPPAPTKPGKKARSEASKLDARVEAVLQRLSENYRRMLD